MAPGGDPWAHGVPWASLVRTHDPYSVSRFYTEYGSESSAFFAEQNTEVTHVPLSFADGNPLDIGWVGE